MIAVRIPEEIRKYKERIVFGLNARQIICVMIICLVCIPLYWFGREKISADLLGWIIIAVSAVLSMIGFLRINGLPAEKFAVIALKTYFLYPEKRKFRSENTFRQLIARRKAERQPVSGRDRKKLEKYQKKAALERAYLLAEAEAGGMAVYDTDPRRPASSYDVSGIPLLTVKEPSSVNQKKHRNKKDGRKMKETKTARQAKRILDKMSSSPEYVPSRKELDIIKKFKTEQLSARKKQIREGDHLIVRKNRKMEHRRKARSVIPRSVQQSIPIIADYPEGIFEIQPNKYSKCYAIKDINYLTAPELEQEDIFVKLGELYNYFSDDMRFQIVLDNRVVSKEEQEHKVFKRMRNDGYDQHRQEYNRILSRQIDAGRNDMQMQKYMTVTIDADSPVEATLKFHKIDAELIQNLKKIGSDGRVLSTTERLEYFHDKFRKGHEGEFRIDYDFLAKEGLSSKDYIAPSYMEFKPKYFRIEDGYYRCLYLNNFPASLQDEFLADVTDNTFPMTASLSIQPVAQDRALKVVRHQLTGIEKDKIEAEKRAVKAGYSPETIQHSIKDAHAQAEELYDDMLNKNQRMFFVTITFIVYGKDLDELDQNCGIVISKARKYTCQMQTLTIQQEEGYRVTLPFGYLPEDMCVDRALTTESTAIFMPFRNQELFQAHGFYYGLNQISHNLVIANRTVMKTPSGFILGSSGSGKSFATKREILNVFLDDDKTGILIIDPENEYSSICKALGGTVIKISADSAFHINPMDMPEDYGLDEDDDSLITPLTVKKEKALKKKSDYLLSIIERMISTSGSENESMITPAQKTIVDRCVRRTYKNYLDHDFDPAYIPTLYDLQDELDREGKMSDEAAWVAEGVEYFTRGSMDLFAHKTNVDIRNRFVVFNVRDLGEQLRQIALIIVFDFIWNRMIENKNRGVRTYCYCDEIHVMFRSYYSADYLKQLYKRGRKYGLVITGITQDVEDLLRSEQARGMISNSDFIMMLNQSSENLRLLAQMLGISESQAAYVTNADAGSGLLFAGGSIVPFADHFPEDSYLYRLLSTKFGEGDESDKEVQDFVNSFRDRTAKNTESQMSDQNAGQ